MLGFVVAVFLLQALLMLVDEGVFHRRRGLSRWERVGHPLDTATVLACYAWLLASRPAHQSLVVYVALVLFSSAFVTKDEPLHAVACTPGEHWVHAMLFVLHPTVLLGAGWLWWTGAPVALLFVALGATAALAAYQILYWSRPWRTAP